MDGILALKFSEELYSLDDILDMDKTLADNNEPDSKNLRRLETSIRES